MSVYVQQIFNGIAQGCTYSLIAIGYAMIFGALRKMNYSHSYVYMFGSMCAYTVLNAILPKCGNMFVLIVVGIASGMLGAALVGFIIEMVSIRPLRKAPRMASSLCTIGFGYFLQEIARFLWGAEDHRFIQNFKWLRVFSIDAIGLSFTNLQLVMFGVTILIILSLQLFLYKTTTGRAIRAISMNETAAQLMGINLNRISSMTFMISSAISGAAGVLVGFYYRLCSPYMGAMPGTKAFAAIVLGGLTSIPGAAISGIILGLSENIAGIFVGDAWRDGVAYAIFFIMLIIRPQGIFGEKKLGG